MTTTPEQSNIEWFTREMNLSWRYSTGTAALYFSTIAFNTAVGLVVGAHDALVHFQSQKPIYRHAKRLKERGDDCRLAEFEYNFCEAVLDEFVWAKEQTTDSNHHDLLNSYIFILKFLRLKACTKFERLNSECNG